jgi:hypothetical protein
LKTFLDAGTRNTRGMVSLTAMCPAPSVQACPEIPSVPWRGAKTTSEAGSRERGSRSADRKPQPHRSSRPLGAHKPLAAIGCFGAWPPPEEHRPGRDPETSDPRPDDRSAPPARSDIGASASLAQAVDQRREGSQRRSCNTRLLGRSRHRRQQSNLQCGGGCPA